MINQVKTLAAIIAVVLVTVCFVSIAIDDADAESSSWYVNKEATGSANGTSETDAWASLDTIEWNSIAEGDTIFISGDYSSDTLTIPKEINVIGSEVDPDSLTSPGSDYDDKPSIGKITLSWDSIDCSGYGQNDIFKTTIQGLDIGAVENATSYRQSNMYVTVTFANCDIETFTSLHESKQYADYTVTFDHCTFESSNETDIAIDTHHMQKVIVQNSAFTGYQESIVVDSVMGSYYQGGGEVEPVTFSDNIFTVPDDGVAINLSGDFRGKNIEIHGNNIEGSTGSSFVSIGADAQKYGGDANAEIYDNILIGGDLFIRYDSSDGQTAHYFDINLNGNAQVIGGEYSVPSVEATNGAEITAEVTIYSNRTDENTIVSTDSSTVNWTYNLSTGVMMFNDSAIPDCSSGSTTLGSTTGQFSWRIYRESVTSLVLNNVTEVGRYAFDQFTALTSVDMTGSGAIDSFAFRDCQSLNDVSIADGFTSIGQSAFSYCSSLTEIVLPDSMAVADSTVFVGCERLTTVDLGGITSIDDRFFTNTSISSITVNEGCTIPEQILQTSTLEKVTIGEVEYTVTAGGELVEDVESGDGIWFVDAQNGYDSNDGKTPKTAWATINNNLAKINNGDTIMLTGGLERATLTKVVNITGYGDNATIVNNLSVNWDAITNESSISGEMTFKNLQFQRMTLQDEGVSTYELSGFTLNWIDCTFKTMNSHMSLVLYGNYHVTVTDCNFIGSSANAYGTEYTDNTYGIFANDCSSLKVTECTFTNYVRSINADSVERVDISNSQFILQDDVLSGDDSIRVIQIAGDVETANIKNVIISSEVGGDSISIHETLSENTNLDVAESSFTGMDLGIVYQVGEEGISNVPVDANNNYFIDENGAAVPIAVGSSDGSIQVPEDLVSNDVYYIDQEGNTNADLKEDNQSITIEPSSDGSAIVLSSGDYNATVTIDFGDIRMIVQGKFATGSTTIRAFALTGDQVSYDFAYEIDTPLMDLSSLTVSVDVNVPEGQRLTGASVYRESIAGSLILIENVIVSGNTVTFVTPNNSVYHIDAVFENILDDTPIGPPIIDDDDDYVPPIYVPSNTSSSDDDTVKIVACAAAAVVAAIMAALLILGHRRD